MQKILAIVWKELYSTFTDRNLLLIMFATPLALASIIGAAFSGFASGGRDVAISAVPVAIVNQDEGVTVALGGTQNLGELFIDLLVPVDGVEDADNALHDLTDAVALSDAQAARDAVSKGEYAAAVIIPPNFSASMVYTGEDFEFSPVTIEIYGDASAPISVSVIRAIVDGISKQLLTGNATIAATIGTVIAEIRENPLLLVEFDAQLDDVGTSFEAAFNPTSNPVKITQQTVSGASATFNPIVYFGAAQAIFFMMFTAQSSANSLLEERRDWTLQRMVITPTPRIVILLGKLLAMFVLCVVQLLVLFVALTLVGSLLAGEFMMIWGTNIPAIILVVVASALAAAGLGTLLTALVRTPEQGNAFGSIIIMAMGIVGGAMFTVDSIPVMSTLSRFTLNWWGTNAFMKLSQNQTDIGLNVMVLLLIGSVMFGIGFAIFNRRLSFS